MAGADRLRPVRMRRIAVVAPRDRLRDALVAMAARGTVELETCDQGVDERPAEALRRVAQLVASPAMPALSRRAAAIEQLEHDRRADLLTGEAELVRRVAAAISSERAAIAVGWAVDGSLQDLAADLQPLGAAVVELDRPRWQEPPTLLQPVRGATAFRTIVDTYGTARYADADPTIFAALTFTVMFGMMFGDLGHGLLLAAAGLWLRTTRRPSLQPLRRIWPLPVAAGLAAAGFGLLYGEAFGSTVIPALWLRPLDSPGTLLLAGVAIGGVLLAASQALGGYNRWREAGATAAVLAPSGVAGLLVLLSLAGGAAAWATHSIGAGAASAALALAGIVLLAAGAIRGATAGPGRGAEATVELFDSLLRMATNAVSFARLAAFGLMHAAVGGVVWKASAGLHGSPAGDIAAILVFLTGNALAFSLEALVAGVQALRLEYYELFSRVFAGEGRPFRPWNLPLVSVQEGL